ncbi:MAG TPA: dienelactone hydrolase family protein, partial [Streptosporangiaceae bacterium]
DFRGHGRSGGLSTMGDREIKDLEVAVAYARELGYQRVATVGFSMGASIVVRHAGLVGGVDAAVSVSGPGRWYYRGTTPMRRVHWAVERRTGRLVTRTWLKTRVSPARWNPVPVPPAEAAARIAPIPFLVVHGDRDVYFPVEHARQLFEAAREPRELWIVPGFGHAESATSRALADRIGAWVRQAVQPAAVGQVTPDGAVAGGPAAAAGKVAADGEIVTAVKVAADGEIAADGKAAADRAVDADGKVAADGKAAARGPRATAEDALFAGAEQPEEPTAR